MYSEEEAEERAFERYCRYSKLYDGRLFKVSYRNIDKAIQVYLKHGKVLPLYLAIGDIEYLLRISEMCGIYDPVTHPDSRDYGDVNDPRDTLWYISDRFNAPQRLLWMKYLINNKLLRNYVR